MSIRFFFIQYFSSIYPSKKANSKFILIPIPVIVLLIFTDSKSLNFLFILYILISLNLSTFHIKFVNTYRFLVQNEYGDVWKFTCLAQRETNLYIKMHVPHSMNSFIIFSKLFSIQISKFS